MSVSFGPSFAKSTLPVIRIETKGKAFTIPDRMLLFHSNLQYLLFLYQYNLAKTDEVVLDLNIEYYKNSICQKFG